MDLGARGAQEHRGEQADRARAEDQRAVAGADARGLGGAQRVAAGLDERAEDGVDAVGQRVQRRHRNGDPLGQRTRQVAPDADLLPVRADVLVAAPAAVAGAVTDHGVAHGPAAHPARVDALAHGADPPAPLVPEAHRVAGVALVQVRHLAGEELDVRAAEADPLDVEDHAADGGRRRLDIEDGRLAPAGHDEGSHVSAPLDATTGVNVFIMASVPANGR